MDRKILNCVQAKPKNVSLIEPNKKVNRGYILRFNYGSEIVNGKYKQNRKDVYLKTDFTHFPKNPFDRQQNTQAGKEAIIIYDKVKTMILEGMYPIIGSHSLKDSENNFIDWLRRTTQENGKYSDNSRKSFMTLINHLEGFAGSRIPFDVIDKSFVARFYDYLKNDSVNSKGIKTTANSSIKYHSAFYHHLAKASALFNFELPPNVRYAQDKTASKPKEYLTQKELQTLIDTPEPNYPLRMGFLFGCFTSLAFAELIKLKYYDVKQDNQDRYYLEFKRQKTGNYNKVPLSNSAIKIIDQMREVNGKSSTQSIFKGLKYSAYTNDILQKWVDRAGIQKKITPHCCRNTYCAIHYDRYKDVGALMKLLDHQDVSTTQRYLATFLKNQEVDIDRLPEFDLGF
tara:strand:+ start:3390 stop:4586 length:1197 start_codon:yes stop_codon:yes gene_type:complete